MIDLIELAGLLAGHQQHLVFAADPAAHHPEVNDHAPVGVVVRVEDQRLGGLVTASFSGAPGPPPPAGSPAHPCRFWPNREWRCRSRGRGHPLPP